MKRNFCLSLVLLAGVSLSYAAPKLKVDVIGTAGQVGSPTMNKNGMVAISRFDGANLWTPETGFRRLIHTTAGGMSAGLEPLDINERGQVTGIAYTTESGRNIERAYIASLDNPLILLANHVNLGSEHGVGLSINNQGTVQGSGDRSGNGDGGYLYGGSFSTWIGPNYAPLAASFGSSPSFINDQNICLGNGGQLFTPGATTFTRVQYPPQTTTIQTKIITDGGKIFGTLSRPGFTTTLNAWSTSGTLLQSIPVFGTPTDANDAGDAVLGYIGPSTSIWNPLTGTITPVQSLLDDQMIADGWQVGLATKISNQGHILAEATDRNGVNHIVRLTPVPEPATLLVLGAGLAGVIARRRKK